MSLYSQFKVPELCTGQDRNWAEHVIKTNHYTRTIPSGKSHYVRYEDAVVVWSIPANMNIGIYLTGDIGCIVWELSRLWAPDGHRRNLLTQAISAAIKIIRQLENPDVLVSYADSNVGHEGFVYRAASWLYLGRCEESRAYRSLVNGSIIPRRAFHSGKRGMTKVEIEASGYAQLSLAGKHRFVMPMNKRLRKKILERFAG